MIKPKNQGKEGQGLGPPDPRPKKKAAKSRKKSQSGVAPANQTKKSQFMNFSQGRSGTKVRDVNRACFPKEKHQNSQKWAKFMNFSFWPFLWFGLPGRLLTQNQLFSRLFELFLTFSGSGFGVSQTPLRRLF